jgi:hypothetical protein
MALVVSTRTDTSGPRSLITIPDEIILHILSFLDVPELLNTSRVKSLSFATQNLQLRIVDWELS